MIALQQSWNTRETIFFITIKLHNLTFNVSKLFLFNFQKIFEYIRDQFCDSINKIISLENVSNRLNNKFNYYPWHKTSFNMNLYLHFVLWIFFYLHSDNFVLLVFNWFYWLRGSNILSQGETYMCPLVTPQHNGLHQEQLSCTEIVYKIRERIIGQWCIFANCVLLEVV